MAYIYTDCLTPSLQTAKHIPAIIFSSDSELLKRLKTRKDESLSHDFVFSSVLGYFGVKTKAYEPEFDIFRQ
ncbi:hypothetical protein [Campylobacter concisus]|uniref:hypothetical protein n=1 Tax=Campylobacter concisus TaxID=199 RepID=UPI001F55656B|nr:hypothetical protein [Campylobacter concisus]